MVFSCRLSESNTMPSSWQPQKDLLSEMKAVPSREGLMATDERLLPSDYDLEHFPGKIQSQMLRSESYHSQLLGKAMDVRYRPLEKLLHILKTEEGVTDWQNGSSAIEHTIIAET